MSAFTPAGSGGLSGGSGGNPVQPATNPLIVEIPLAVAGTEYPYLLPVGTKQFVLSARQDNVTLHVGYATTSTYLTVRRGCFYSESEKTLTGITLHITSDKPTTVVELLVWT